VCKLVIVEKVARDVSEERRVFWREEATSNLVNALLQLHVLLVVFSRFVAATSVNQRAVPCLRHANFANKSLNLSSATETNSSTFLLC